jgi:hypothetical protein
VYAKHATQSSIDVSAFENLKETTTRKAYGGIRLLLLFAFDQRTRWFQTADEIRSATTSLEIPMRGASASQQK